MKFHSAHAPICDVHVALDEHNAQEWGMLAALFSRSSDGCLALVDRVQREGASGRFMESYYVGYGHESIGDLVDVKLFIENVPFYIAAIIEHHSQFRGQESSTRYIDFSKQRPSLTANPDLYKHQIDFYNKYVLDVEENIRYHNRTKLAHLDEKERKMHERAIKARSFDMCRSLLPLGATTNVAWYGTVRSIKQHLSWMMEGPYNYLAKPYASWIMETLREVYPESIEDMPRASKPWVFDDADYTLTGMLDFGSWRDLNRHRVGVHESVPLPDTDSAFHPWYLEMLSTHGIMTPIPPTSLDSCYLGQTQEVSYSCPQDQLIYVSKLRTKPTVHPTLRQFMHENIEDIDRNTTTLDNIEIDLTYDPGALGYIAIRGNDTIVVHNDK